MTRQQTTDSGSTASGGGGRGPQLAEQASAMFDGELPAAECELLARRLSTDAALQRQWSRHALIGAAMRGEPLAVQREARALRDSVAARVRAELNSDGAASPSVETVHEAAESGAGQSALRWGRPLAGIGIAAGVAALSIFWVRGAGESPVVVAPGMVASASLPATPSASAPSASAPSASTIVTEVAASGIGASPAAGSEVVLAPPSSLAANAPRRTSGEPESYVVPMPSGSNGSIASTQLANYVVAHSEFSGALTRRSALSALVTAEALPAVPETTAVVPPPVGNAATDAGAR